MKTVVIAASVALVALASGFYLFGAPNTSRDSAAAADPSPVIAADPATFRAMLVAQTKRLPRDGRGWMLLARSDFAANRYAEAAASYAQVVTVSANVARDPDAWCEYADALGMAQGGSLAGKPRELIARALSLDPNNARALEMAGSAALEQNDPATAVEYWRQLVVLLPARSAERNELVVALARAEEIAASARREGEGR